MPGNVIVKHLIFLGIRTTYSGYNCWYLMLPKRQIFLKAKWENLVMINYEVDPAILLPHLPFPTELDAYNNKTVVSVVGFMFNDCKVFGIKWPFHSSFEEVNLRFYVKHFDGTTWKRGVVFISEIVPRLIIAKMANLLYREHYSAKPMKHTISIEGSDILIDYQWKHLNSWNSINVTADASLSNIIKGSEEEFIFEHYWGYSKYSPKTTIEYEVEHAMWQVHKVKNWAFTCNVASLYGEEFAPYLSAEPTSVLLAKGSEVVIRKPLFIKSD